MANKEDTFGTRLGNLFKKDRPDEEAGKMSAKEKAAEAKRLKDEAAAKKKDAEVLEKVNKELTDAAKDAADAETRLQKAQNAAGYQRRKAADESKVANKPANDDKSRRKFNWLWILVPLLFVALLWHMYSSLPEGTYRFRFFAIDPIAETLVPATEAPADDDAAVVVDEDFVFTIYGFEYKDGKNFSVDPQDLEREWVNFPTLALENWGKEFNVNSLDLVKDPGSLSLIVRPDLPLEAFEALMSAAEIDRVYFVYAGDATEFGNWDYNSDYLRAHLYRRGGPQ